METYEQLIDSSNLSYEMSEKLLIQQLLDLLNQNGRLSTCYLMRKLRVSASKAEQLMKRLEEYQ